MGDFLPELRTHAFRYVFSFFLFLFGWAEDWALADSGAATTSHPVQDDDGTTKWISPVVEVKKNRLTTSAGRLGADEGTLED